MDHEWLLSTLSKFCLRTNVYSPDECPFLWMLAQSQQNELIDKNEIISWTSAARGGIARQNVDQSLHIYTCNSRKLLANVYPPSFHQKCMQFCVFDACLHLVHHLCLRRHVLSNAQSRNHYAGGKDWNQLTRMSKFCQLWTTIVAKRGLEEHCCLVCRLNWY